MATLQELLEIKDALKNLPICSNHEIELVHALSVLERLGGNRTKTSKTLKIALRSVRRWIPLMEHLGLKVLKWNRKR